MKKPTRVELYNELCKRFGMTPKSDTGYFTRKEMLEMVVVLDRENEETKKGNESCLSPNEE